MQTRFALIYITIFKYCYQLGINAADGEKTIPEETFHGVPRSKIPWHPTIDYEKCVSCGKCVDYCKLGVYALEEKQGKKRPVVKNPHNCVVFCKGCDEICPVGAIKHPSKREVGKIINRLRKEQT